MSDPIENILAAHRKVLPVLSRAKRVIDRCKKPGAAANVYVLDEAMLAAEIALEMIQYADEKKA